MTDNNTLQAHIDEFDRLVKAAADFEESVLRASHGKIFTASFDVFLTRDLTVSASASVGADGEVLEVTIGRYEYDDRNGKATAVAHLPVERNSGLWCAMEIWLEALSNNPESN